MNNEITITLKEYTEFVINNLKSVELSRQNEKLRNVLMDELRSEYRFKDKDFINFNSYHFVFDDNSKIALLECGVTKKEMIDYAVKTQKELLRKEEVKNEE